MAAISAELLYFVGTDGVPFTVSTHLDTTVNLYQKLDLNGVATANSPDNAILAKDCYLVDVACATAATGTVEIVSNGKRTQIMMDIAAHDVANSGRPALRIPFSKGTELRLLAVTALT